MNDVHVEQPLIYQGDCLNILPTLESNSVDLIVTSPPYADQRKDTYGGVSPDKYVEWFLPIADELKRVLKIDSSSNLFHCPTRPLSLMNITNQDR